MAAILVEVALGDDMPKKGHKSQKGLGDIYEETKKNTMLVLTQTAKENLDQMATSLGISRSEVVERFARGVISQPGELTLEDKQVISKSA